MRQYASALSQRPVAAHAVGEAAGQLMETFGGEDPDLVVCFASPHFVGTFDDMTRALRELLSPRVLLGATAVSIVAGQREIEEAPALAVFAARLPEATLTPVLLRVTETPDGATVTGWPALDHEPSTLLLLADPFSFPVDGFLRRVNDDRPDLAVIGGLASAAMHPGGNRLALDDRVESQHAVGVLLEGVPVTTVVSQGCRPIGRPYVVTRGEQNLLEELGGRPALERLRELAAAATDEERALLQRGVHVGLVVDEHKVDFTRGDFLVRNVLGADERTGALAVGDRVRLGQTVQFHVRDASAADEDLRELLDGRRADAALVFTCNGRGRHLFGTPDHDAATLAECLGPLPTAGMFCAGEVGPIGGRNSLHGFTASLALFA